MLLEGAGERAQNAFERRGRAPNDLQALAAAVGARADRRGGDGAVGRARRAHRAAHGLRGDGRGRGAVLGGAAAGEGGDRRRGRQGGAGRRRGAHRAQRGRAQRRAGRPGRARRSSAATSRTSRRTRGSARRGPTAPATPVGGRSTRSLDLVPADPRKGVRRPPGARPRSSIASSVLEVQPAFGAADRHRAGAARRRARSRSSPTSRR